MGGNLAVVVAAGQMMYVTGCSKYSATGVVSTVKSTSLKAFAVRRRSSAGLPPAGSGGPLGPPARASAHGRFCEAAATND